MPNVWAYWELFEAGKSDEEVAEELGVTVATVARKRDVRPVYSLGTVREPVLEMAAAGRKAKTIYRELRSDFRWHPFSDMLLLQAILRVLAQGGSPSTENETREAVEEALPPSVRGFAAEKVKRRVLRDVLHRPGI